MPINDSGRKKLTIVKLLEKRRVGDAEVQEFTAKVEGEDATGKHGVWSKALYEYIKESTTIDCDVVTKKSDKNDPDGNPYWNRRVSQIYVDGKPAIDSSKRSGYPQKDSASIEAQVAIKEIGECWRVGKFADDSPEVSVYRGWLRIKLGNILLDKAPEKQKPEEDTTKVAPSPQAKDAKAESTGKTLTADAVYKKLAKVIAERNWAEVFVKEKFTNLGGKGEKTWAMVKSLTSEKLAELDKELNEALKPVDDENIPF